jgi:hypothetical protein
MKERWGTAVGVIALAKAGACGDPTLRLRNPVGRFREPAEFERFQQDFSIGA